MSIGFLYIKSQDRIIPFEQIIEIDFEDEGSDNGEDLLAIMCTDAVADVELTGEEAEEAYLLLLKKLPNLITIGK